MKKVFGIFALLLALAACNKEQEIQQAEPVGEEEEVDRILVTATLPSQTPVSKAIADNEDGKITATWAVGDIIAVIYDYDRIVAVEADVIAVNPTTGEATIEFYVYGGTEDGTPCTLIYPWSATQDYGTVLKDNATLLGKQDGTLNSALDVRKAEGTINVQSSKSASLTLDGPLAPQFAIFKFTTYDPVTGDNFAVKQLVVCEDGKQDFVITPAEASSSFYAFLPPVSGKTVSFSALSGDGSKFYTFSRDGVSFEAGKYYQSTLQMTERSESVPPHALSSKFSVGAGHQVFFSNGNLQARYAYGAWTWSFADSQYDAGGVNNTHITASEPFYDAYLSKGPVDLFGWVGKCSSFSGVAAYGITSNIDSGMYGNIPGESLKYDWGLLVGTGWRTPTSAEWDYLLETRSVNNTLSSGARYMMATIAGRYKGLVIFPDDYQHPAGVSVSGAVYNNPSDYTATISQADWAKMEEAGAVFLRANGERIGNTVNYADYQTGQEPNGYYWSSASRTGIVSSYNSQAYNLHFDDEDCDATNFTSRASGCSVRLVKDVARMVDLSTLTGDYVAQDGDILTGTLAGDYKISITHGATVTLLDATISRGASEAAKWAGINCDYDATLVLIGDNIVKGFQRDYPGIYIAPGHTLTIEGTGTLEASSNGRGAGIGGGYGISFGNIDIKGRTITATGGTNAAGIGGGDSTHGGTITIESSVQRVTVPSCGGYYSIGAGSYGDCGRVTIGGTVGAITVRPYTYPMQGEPEFYSATADDIGKIIGSDGKIYNNEYACINAGVGYAAMIAYIGSDSNCAHGLAISVRQDLSRYSWKGAWELTESFSPAGMGGVWRLPSKDDWYHMINDSGWHYGTLNSLLSNCQADTLIEGADFYWTSTEVGTTQARTIQFNDGYASVSDQGYDKVYNFCVRLVLAF